ncbi:MAG: hypothetical protein ACE5JQ_17630 [Candidatus Methylomirabilales bacterium]
MLVTILHLLAMVVFIGGTLLLGVGVIPAVRRHWREDPEGLRFLAEVIRIFHPLSLAALGILVLTGAFGLTGLKAGMGAGYVRVVGVLAIKLLVAFVLILVSTYQFFAVGVKITRAVRPEGVLPAPEVWGRWVSRLQVCSLLSVVLGIWILYLGLVLGRSA